MQIVVPNNQLGRVDGGFTTVADAATVASVSLAGVAGSALGIPVVFVLAGIVCVIMGFVAWLLLPTLTLKDQVETEPPEDVMSQPTAADGRPVSLRAAESAS